MFTWNVIGFALTTLHDWLKKKSRHFFIQSEEKPKSNVTRSLTFSRASYQLRVTTSSFDKFSALSASFMIGLSDYFDFGFTTLN